MSLEERLSEAARFLGRGESEEAEVIAQRVAEEAPDNARAWHLLGLAHAQRGRSLEATECFERATELAPSKSLYHYNLALAYRGCNRVDEAIQSYQRAVELNPDAREARNNLGNLLAASGENRKAIDCFRELVERFPDHADGHFNLANLLQETGHTDEAVAHYRQAIEIDPDMTAARENLGRAFIDDDRPDEAAEVWEAWSQQDPDHPVPRHMLAALRDDRTVARCEDDFVRATFDEDFAKNFDQQLAKLHYQAPQLVGDAVNAWAGTRRELITLDAGCGTGLGGPFLRPLSKRLIGVDLSEAMLIEAEKRELYDELVAEELGRFLESAATAFDLIVVTDTLCYFGELPPILLAAARRLSPGGALILTVEADTDSEPTAGFRLRPHGRYTHARDYLIESLGEAGLRPAEVKEVVLRKEVGRDVPGYLVTAELLDDVSREAT